MNNSTAEEKFNLLLDKYLYNDGTNIINNEELNKYRGLLEIGKCLKNYDFSKRSDKDKIYNKIMNNNEKHKTKSFKLKLAIVPLTCVIAIFMIQPVVGEVYKKIVNTLSFNHVNGIQTKVPIQTVEVPPELKGKLFDKDGNVLYYVSSDYDGKIYNENGEEIVDTEGGKVITAEEREKENQNKYLYVYDISDINKYSNFDFILPSYLPGEFKFDKAELFKGEDGIVCGDYIDINYVSDVLEESINLSMQKADEKTDYVISSEAEIEPVKINGVDGIYYSNKSINWAYKGTVYLLKSHADITKSQLIKIAKSIKE